MTKRKNCPFGALRMIAVVVTISLLVGSSVCAMPSSRGGDIEDPGDDFILYSKNVNGSSVVMDVIQISESN